MSAQRIALLSKKEHPCADIFIKAETRTILQRPCTSLIEGKEEFSMRGRNRRRILFLLLPALLLAGCSGGGNPSGGAPFRESDLITSEDSGTTEGSSMSDATISDTPSAADKSGPASNGDVSVPGTASTAKPTAPVTRPPDGRPIRIACVGDSITEGVGASDKAKTSYPARLQEILGDGYTVGNFGHGGTTVTSYPKFSEYSDSLAFEPDVVLIFLGTNDCINMTDSSKVQAWKNAYENLLTIYQNQPSNPRIYAVTALYRSDYTQRRWTLENVIVPAQKEMAAQKGVQVIDVYELTKDYFASAFYNAGDRLHPTDTGYMYLAEAIASALTGGPTGIRPEPVAPTPDKVVYVKDAGSSNHDGSSPQKAISNLAEAVRLCRGGGTIVICGTTTVKRTAYLPYNAYGITVTSEYGGTDYRTSGAKLAFTGTEALNQGLFLSGDYVFENLKLECGHSDVRMVMQYHNVTVGEGVSCSRTGSAARYMGLVCGYDVSSLLQTEEDLTLGGECRVTVKSGTFDFLYGGNLRRTAALPDTDSSRVSPSLYPYGGIGADGRLLLTVDGGHFVGAGAISVGFGPCAGEGSLQINGGTFDAELQLISWPGNHLSASRVPPVTGRVLLQIRGGLFRSASLRVQPSDGPVFRGEAAVAISGGEFEGLSALEGVSGSRLTLSPEYRRLQSLASGFDTVTAG